MASAGIKITTERIKRLCVLSDGTWDFPEKETDTNILNLSRAIKHEGEGQIQQIIYYDAGVGTDGTSFEKLKGGAIGEGIDTNIVELYTFLAFNYHPGDEIYLFGYSRGAYTVRSLAGLIYEAGLVRREKFDKIGDAYKLYRSNPGANSERARNFRAENGERVRIKLLACFDTVGSLGLPWETPPFLPDWHAKYRFHSTEVSDMVDFAVHMLSIDEDKGSFRPTMMQAPGGDESKLDQYFFPGTHGGIGGGNANRGEKLLASNTLRYLYEVMKKKVPLEINESWIPTGGNFNVPPAPSNFLGNALKFLTGQSVRKIASIDQVHTLAIKRYQAVPKWRPPALEPLREKLEKFDLSTREK